ncbi:MAG: glutamate--tRNA ligase [Defluviitaleaceae bacterium]|nr:glutamate--tRNA ligase [Defluviitaleaceae bacterium]
MRTRFAPSPTGFMHIGGLRTALFCYLLARKMDGTFILRIEDTDQTRFVEGASERIYSALKDAGITYDEGPDVGGDYGPYIQSERKDIYLKYAKELIDAGKAYRCYCTKEELEERVKSGNEFDVNPYDRKCLGAAGREGAPYVVRQLIPEGRTSYFDEVFGEISVENAEMDDQVLIKSDGMPTYNFANVIDDHLMKITHIMRGNEFLSTTPKHKMLYEAFGWDVPTYVHLPLILSPDGGKLSKRKGDAFFEDFVEKGYLPQALVNFIALLGFAPPDNREIFTLDELVEVFGIEGISKSPSTFDTAKLKWMNGEYLKAMDAAEFAPLAVPYITKGVQRTDVNVDAIAAMVKDRIGLLDEIPAMLDFIDDLPEYDIELFNNKKNTVETAKDMLTKLLPEIEGYGSEWTTAALSDFIGTFAENNGVKKPMVLWPVRCALSGKEASPGAVELLGVFSKAECVSRIKKALGKLE